MKEGETMTMHTLGCPALLAWDIPGACTCGGRRVTVRRPLDAEPDPHPFANVPPEALRRAPKRVRCDVCSRTDPHVHCADCGATDHAASHCDMEG